MSDHDSVDTHEPGVADGEPGRDQSTPADHPRGVPPRLIAHIREVHRERTDYLRAEGNLTRQIKSRLRRLEGGDKEAANARYKAMLAGTDPDAYALNVHFLTARDTVATQRKGREKDLEELARQLPVWPTFAEPLHGMGAVALGQIVGEAGDLSAYANPAKLWKRMGLAVIDGKSQRRTTDKVKAIEQGYSPIRRSVMWVIGDALIRTENRYRELYLTRKEVEVEKLPESSKMHWHRRAHRYMEKRLLRDLWTAWRNGDHARADTHGGCVAVPARLERSA